MAKRRRKNAVDEKESDAVVREIPSELPSDGSIQVAYTADETPVYVYYDYDLNVFRNYQTDEEISLDGLYEEGGAPFHFFAETQDVTSPDLDNANESTAEESNESEEDDADTPSHEDVMSQNTETAYGSDANDEENTDEHQNEELNSVGSAHSDGQDYGDSSAKSSIKTNGGESSDDHANLFSGKSSLGNNARVREIIESILTGDSSGDIREKIFDKEQELLDIQSFQTKMFNDYSALLEIARQKRRTISSTVNDAIVTIKSIISSMINENRQYISVIKQNAHVVSEKQYIVYNELAANFQYVASNNMTLTGSDYEQMKRCYIECWNYRKKIIENLRLMYEFEAVIARLQYYVNLFNVTSSKVLDSLSATAKALDNHILDFISSCNNEKLVSRYVSSYEGIRRFKDNSRALLNEIDGTLIGIDKRRLFDGISDANHKKYSNELKSSARSNFPTMQVDTISFLNNDEGNDSGNYRNGGNKTRYFNNRMKPKFKKFNGNNNGNNASGNNGTNFVTLSPNSTVKIDDGHRF